MLQEFHKRQLKTWTHGASCWSSSRWPPCCCSCCCSCLPGSSWRSRWLSFGDLSLLLRGRWGREAWGEAIFFSVKERGVAVERENLRYFTLRWARESRPCCSCWCARCRWNSCSTCTWAFTLYLSTWRRVIVLRQIRREQMFSWRSWERTLSKKCSAFFPSAETSPSEKQLTCRKNSLSFVFSKYETMWVETFGKVNLWQHLILITVFYQTLVSKHHNLSLSNIILS